MARRVNPCKTLAKGRPAFFNTKGLEPEEDGLVLVTTWGDMRSYLSFYKGVAKAITSHNPTSGGSLIMGHLTRYWAIEASQETRSVLNSLKSPQIPEK